MAAARCESGCAWGEQQPSSNGYSYNLRLPGQCYDAEAGLHNNVNRDYDPPLGQHGWSQGTTGIAEVDAGYGPSIGRNRNMRLVANTRWEVWL